MWRTASPTLDPGLTLSAEVALADPLQGSTSPPTADADLGDGPAGTVSTPDLRGMASRDALRLGRMSDLRVWVRKRPTAEATWDRVLAQDPAPGVPLWPGSTITLTIGERPAVEVPDVRGGEEAEMLTVLRQAGLRPDRRVARRSDRVPEGHIVKTRPRAGSMVPLGTKLTYVVATPRPAHGPRAHRQLERVRARRLPDGSFLSLPSEA
jgi:beta-lactam-binding protein with PASTA domain